MHAYPITREWPMPGQQFIIIAIYTEVWCCYTRIIYTQKAPYTIPSYTNNNNKDQKPFHIINITSFSKIQSWTHLNNKCHLLLVVARCKVGSSDFSLYAWLIATYIYIVFGFGITKISHYYPACLV